MEKPKILIVDDDVDILRSAEIILQRDFQIKTAVSVHQAKSILTNSDIDVAVIDLNFEGQEQDGLALLKFVFRERPRVPVVVLSNDSKTKRVVAATSYNLAGFVAKEGEFEADLRIAITKGLEIRESKFRQTNEQHVFKTRSPKVKKVLEAVDRIAASPGESAILITGESGSGKEFLANHIAGRLKKNIVAANMANIGNDVAESELFGHVRGAFTGAIANKVGLIEMAHNGIFFLDELGECSLDVQAKLLRAIQEKEIQPVGSSTIRTVNVRFIGATNRNLADMVENGTFRQDLYYRLNVIQLRLPPLRERPEDILYYTNLFLDELSPGRSFSVESSGLDLLLGHSWPGNVRELRNVIERIVVLSDRRSLDAESVGAALLTDERSEVGTHSQAFSVRAVPTRGAILEALERTKGNRSHAAAMMGVHRTTFLRWIRDFGLKDAVGYSPKRTKMSGDQS